MSFPTSTLYVTPPSLSPPSLSFPSPGHPPRSVSDHSPVSRTWQPSVSGAITGTAVKVGPGRLSALRIDANLEREFSSCTKTGHPLPLLRADADFEVLTMTDRAAGDADKQEKRASAGWGGSLVSGAMNATVFGAALGLQVYCPLERVMS